MSKIKVFHVLGALNCGGAESLIMNIYRNINRDIYEFHFIIHTDEECYFAEEIRKMGGRIYIAPKFIIFNIIQYKLWWRKFLSNISVDIIHSHMTSTAGLYFGYTKKYNIKTIAHSHNTSNGHNLTGYIKTHFEKMCIHKSNLNLACSVDAGLRLFSEKKFYVLNNGIDLDKFLFNKQLRNKVRSKHNITNEFVFGHIGRFTLQKNHLYLINIFDKYVKNINSNSLLILCGDGELESEVKRHICNLNLDDKVIFTGVVSNVNEYMMAFDFFLFPSLYEGLGIVLIEAQAAGLNIIASDVVPKEVDITNNIKFLPLTSVEEWVNSISLSNNREEHKDVVKNCEFNIEKTVSEISKFYIMLYEEKYI